MKSVVLLVLYVFINHANAQDDAITQTSFDALAASYAKFVYSDTSKALRYAIKGKELALLEGNEEQLVQFSYYISKCQNRLDKNSIALQNIETAIAEGTIVKDSLFLYKCFYLKGDILSELGEDSKALIAYLRAKVLAPGEPIYEIPLLIDIASLKKKHKDFQEAIDLYKSCLKALNTIENTRDTEQFRLIALMHIADAYLWMEQPEDAEIYNKIGLQQCSENDKPWMYYPLVMNKAIIFYQKKQYQDCIKLATKVRDFSKAKNENLYLSSLFYLGKSSYQLAAYKKTIYYLEKAYAIINSSADVDINEKELHEFLALAYHKEKQPEKTIFHYEKYSALEKKQSLQDVRLNNEIHKLVDISPLKAEIAALGTKLSTQTKSKNGLMIASVIFLFLFLSSIFYYTLREKSAKKKFKELLKKVSELENVQKKKIGSQKNEVSDENVRTILDKIEGFEKEALYVSSECSLSFMAEKLETNATYLSKVLNRYKGKSYTAYITELRINTALVRLKNQKKLQSYTIKAIAEEFGFKRQETFSRAFKAQTGMYPSQYLKNLSKNNASVDES